MISRRVVVEQLLSSPRLVGKQLPSSCQVVVEYLSSICQTLIQKLLSIYRAVAKRSLVAEQFSSHSETTSGHFGSLYEMTEVTQTVVTGTESELT